MANRTYLFYKDKENQTCEFEYATNIPSLWQELFDIETVSKQKHQLIKLLKDDIYNEETTLKISKEIAVDNLKFWIDFHKDSINIDKKQLRYEFLQFIETEVLDQSIIELSYEEISWFFSKPEDFFNEFEKFYTDFETQKKYQTEIVTYQTIGFNGAFEPFSTIYQKITAKQNIINKEIQIKNQANQEKVKQREKRKKLYDLLTMSTIAGVLTFFGFWGIFAKNETKTGLFMLIFALICWLYVYIKHLWK